MAKISEQIKRGIEGNKKAIAEGKDYASGVAIQAQKLASKKVGELMAEQRKKNKGLPKSLQTCKFYPVYCSCTGHVDAQSRSCGMFGTSKQQKEDAVKEMKKRLVGTEAKILAEEMQGTCYTVQNIYCFSFFFRILIVYLCTYHFYCLLPIHINNLRFKNNI